MTARDAAPAYEVTVGGQQLGGFLAGLIGSGGAGFIATNGPRLIELEVSDEAGGESDTCALTFVRAPGMAAPQRGDPVTVKLGYRNTGIFDMGQFTVDEVRTNTDVHGGRTISITATSANMTSTAKSSATKTPPKDRTVQSVVSEVAGRLGLTPAVGASVGSLIVHQSDQTHESPMHFLARLAKDVGADFKITDGRLVFVARGANRSASGKAMAPISVPVGNIRSVEWVAGDRQTEGQVTAFWYDQAAAERTPVSVGDGEGVRTLPRTYRDEATARIAAEAERKRGKAAGETAEVEMVGDPSVRAGQALELPPLEPEHAGEWTVRRALHRLGVDSGLVLNTSLERPS